jgi:hypothetical protein
VKTATALVKLFIENGFTLARNKNHQVWYCPCGRHQVVSSSSGEGKGRADKNVKADIKRTLRACATIEETATP